MSTTNVGFIVTSGGAPISPANAAKGVVLALDKTAIAQLIAKSEANRIDVETNLSTAGYAKNAAFFLALAASTPANVDLTAIASSSTSSAGDDSLANAFDIQFLNLGTQPVTIGAAASHPFLFGMGGTSPTIVLPAGGLVHIICPAGLSIASGTNSILKFDPGGSAAQVVTAIGGS